MTCLILGAPTPSAAQPAHTTDGPLASASRNALEPLRAQFLRLDEYQAHVAVEFIAHEQFAPSVPVGVALTGSAEFAASGDMWRTASNIPGYPGMNTIASFDGELFYYFTPETGTLGVSLSGDEPQSSGMSIINPLLALATAFTPDRVDRISPTLREARRHAANRDSVTPSRWEVSTTPSGVRRSTAGFQREVVELDGARRGATTVHVLFEGDELMPRSIQHFDAQGELVASFVFTEYRDVHDPRGDMRWPALVEIKGFRPGDQTPAVQMTLAVEWMRVGPDAADGVDFSLPLHEADSLWIEEARGFVR